MDFTESKDESEFRARLRAWLMAHAPREWRDDPSAADEPEVELWRIWSRDLYEAGWIGLTWPPEYGGGGLDSSYQNIFLQELARADLPNHIGPIGLGFVGPTIISWGTEEQKRTLLPPMLRGEEVWCQGFSEPSAGSDLSSGRTRADLDGVEWVVNGQKIWSSFAHIADRAILLVRTEPDAPQHKGLSLLLVDMHSPGIDVRPITQITGIAEFNEMFFDDLRVPAANMLGQRGEGWKVAMTTLGHERGTTAMSSATNLEKRLGRFVSYALELGVSDQPRVREAIARAWISLQSIRLTNLRQLSAARGAGTAPGPEASVAKLEWTSANQALTTLALDLQGLAGSLDGASAVDHGYWQNARLRARGNSIEGGTGEIVRSVIAERVLKLPRSR